MEFKFYQEYGKMKGIYRITNNVNGNIYIGQTLDSFKRRYSTHKYECFNKRRRNKLYNSMRKYGWENFSFDIMHFCNNENEIDDLERKYIKLFNCLERGLNLDSGGNLNKHHSEETKRKIGRANKGNKACLGRKHTEESKRKMSKIQTGKKMSKEACMNNSLAKKGNKYWLGKKHTEGSKKKMSASKSNISDATRKKLSESHKGYKHTEEAKIKVSKSLIGNQRALGYTYTQEQLDKRVLSRGKPVFMYTNKEIVKYFASIKEAGEWIISQGISQSKKASSSINRCCRGNLKTAYSYKWTYAKLEE